MATAALEQNRQGASLPAFGRRIVEAYRRRAAYRKSCNELYALSDRQLDDMGISRSMIHHVAYVGAYGEERL